MATPVLHGGKTSAEPAGSTQCSLQSADYNMHCIQICCLQIRMQLTIIAAQQIARVTPYWMPDTPSCETRMLHIHHQVVLKLCTATSVVFSSMLHALCVAKQFCICHYA